MRNIDGGMIVLVIGFVLVCAFVAFGGGYAGL
jgi:hypothetical protein